MRFNNWTTGFAFGGIMGILFGAWPPLGTVFVLVFLALAWRTSRPAAALAGLLVGAPGLWMALLTWAAFSCMKFEQAPGQVCIGPDLIGWYLVPGAAFLAGIALTWRETQVRR